jgi:hypothetical protein
VASWASWSQAERRESAQVAAALSVSINELRSARLRITQTVSTATELEAQVNE